MIILSKILTAGIFATIAMTALSYGLSHLFKSNFKEPQLLNYLIDKLPNFEINIAREHILGWALHFSIGFLFVTIFLILNNFYNFPLTILTGIIFGALAGLVGIAVWSTAFALHPNPPSINKPLYYIQLLAAHIVFGISMILVLQNI